MRLDVEQRGDIAAAIASLGRRRRPLLRAVLSRLGRDYERRVVTEYLSGRGGALGGLSERALAGLKARGRNRQIATARAALDTNPFTAGRTQGLNRVTGFAARSWNHLVIEYPDAIQLVEFTNAPYLRYHSDDYTAPGGARRFPVRLPALGLWRQMTQAEDLVARIDAAAAGVG